MSLYHLDPRQAGTRAFGSREAGAAPDVDVYVETTSIDTRWHWHSVTDARGCHTLAANFCTLGYETESAALAAARQAAGFGHVAERACDNYQAKHGLQLGGGVAYECDTCAWPRDAHASK